MHSSRTHALLGIASGILFVVWAFLTKQPGGEDSNADYARWLDDDGHRVASVAAAYVLAASMLLFIAFVFGTLRALEAHGANPALVSFARAASFLSAGSVMAGGSAGAAAALFVNFQEPGTAADPAVAIAGFVGSMAVMIPGMLAAAATIVAVSAATKVSGTFPAWTAWAGFLCAAVLLFSIMFVPMMAFPIWIVALSTVQLARPVTAPVAHPALG